MIENIVFPGPIRSKDNDLYQECREFIRNKLYNRIPLVAPKLTMIMVVQEAAVVPILHTIDSLLAQDFKDWALNIIDDGAGISQQLERYHKNPKIRIYTFNKPMLLAAPYINVMASYAASGADAKVGVVFPGQKFKDGALVQAIQALEGSAKIVCGHMKLPQNDISINCHRTALFFKREAYKAIGGMEERWATRSCYDWEFVMQASTKGIAVQNLEMLSAQEPPKISISASVREKAISLRESYVYPEPRICVIWDIKDAVFEKEELQSKIAFHIDSQWSGMRNVSVLIQGSNKIEGVQIEKKVSMQRAIDTGASLLCQINHEAPPFLGWLRRLHVASLASEAGVYCEWAAAEENNVMHSKGIDLVRAPYIATACAMMRKRFVEAYDLYNKSFDEAAAALVAHQMQVCFTKVTEAVSANKDSITSTFSAAPIQRFKTIRVLCSSDKQSKEVWWGDYWFKNSIVNALRAFGVKVVRDDQVADIDFFIHANRPDMRVRAPIKISWVVTRPGAALQQLRYFKNFNHVFNLSSPACARFIQNGVPSSYLPCGTACEYSYDPDEEKIYDFCMIGNTSKPRRVKLMERLKAAGYTGAIYGTGWNGQPALSDFWKGFYWSNQDLPTLFNKSKLVIYCHWDEMRDKGMIAQRLLDTCATGAPILTDENIGLGKYGLNEVPKYTTDEDFMTKMKYYTRNEDNWKGLVEQAKRYSRAARKTDFVVVAEEIINQLQKLKKI